MCQDSWFDEGFLQKRGRHVRRRKGLGIDYSELLMCAYLLINILAYKILSYVLIILKTSFALFILCD